jgi:hypothetical protein
MQTLSRILCLLIVTTGLTGCIYSSVVQPFDRDVQETQIGSKTGRASLHVVAWLVAWGDAGVEAAAANGDIAVINHLDVERRLVLFGLYSRVTTIAYGD